jgi:hypothetical protein
MKTDDNRDNEEIAMVTKLYTMSFNRDMILLASCTISFIISAALWSLLSNHNPCPARSG